MTRLPTFAFVVRPGNSFLLPGGNNVVKISQYADDTSSFMCSDTSLHALFGLFAKYKRASEACSTKANAMVFCLIPGAIVLHSRWF